MNQILVKEAKPMSDERRDRDDRRRDRIAKEIYATIQSVCTSGSVIGEDMMAEIANAAAMDLLRWLDHDETFVRELASEFDDER
jgi:hypothetical protein